MAPQRQKTGLPPGTPVYTGRRRVERATITVIDYDENSVREHVVPAAEACRDYMRQATVTWVNLTGLHDAALMRDVGRVFNIHSLTQEDIVSTGQRPKLEDHGEHLFLVFKMLYRSPDGGRIVSEQVSLLLGRHYVLSFQEVEGDVFDLIRERIRSGGGRIRRMGCDYLAYALLDAVVDHYFLVLEDVGDRIEAVQEQVTQRSEPDTLETIHALKRELVFMRRNLWPLRELVGGLEKTESRLLSKALAPYLRDVYEHTIQVIDTVESLRDLLSGALDIYMTMVSNRMNEVMKVLTIIATVFIPLTFVAGIYGMNFRHMPELEWRLGYPAAVAVMLAVAGGMLLFFKRKKWL